MRKNYFFIFLLIFVFCVANAEEDIRIHGFMSQGFMKSNNNNYLTKSEKGSFEFNEAAFNIFKEIDDNLTLGLQIFSRDLGDQGNNEFKLDWGFADYSIDDEHGFRIGKIKMPFGLYNTGRDVDLLRNEIFLPQSVYDEGMRDFMNSMNGFSYYRNYYTEKSGNIELEFLTGTFNVDSNSSYMKNIVGSLSNTGIILSDFNFTCYYNHGMNIKYETPVEGLTTNYSYYKVKGDIVADVDATALIGSTNPAIAGAGALLNNTTRTFKMNVEKNYAVSAEYFWEDYVITHERRRLDASLLVPVLNVKESMTNDAYYTKLSYRLDDRSALSLYSSTFYENKDDHDKSSLTEYQIDNAISYRYDVNYNFILKLEYHDMEGAAHVYKHLNSTYKKDWNFIALKATISF